MLIRIKDVLLLEGFKNAKLVAGAGGLENTVSNAMLMEVPDIYPYVDKDYLLITTLFPISKDPEALRELIPKLHEQGVSGICIKPFRYIENILPEMIRQGDELGFPVIELSAESNLSGLVMEILEISLNKHIDMLNFRDHVHKTLMQLFLKGKGIPELLNNLSEICVQPVVLLDEGLKVIMKSQDLSDEVVTTQGKYENKTLKILVGKTTYHQEDYFIHPIKAGNRGFGYIIMLKGGDGSESLLVAVEEASLLIASVYYKNYAVLEKERSFQDSFIRDILQGKISSPMDTVNKARYFGWNMDFPQVIMTMKLLIKDEKLKKDSYKDILDSRYIDETLETELHLTSKKYKIVYLDDSMVIFVNSIFMGNQKEGMQKAGEKLISGLPQGFRAGIGISDQALSIEDLPRAYKEARTAIEAGSVLNSRSFVSRYTDYAMFSIINEIGDKEVMESFVERKLGGILAYDKSHEGGLLETLKVLIEENFNARKASEKLFIHYNTMRHRLEKMKELGLDLENGFSVGEVVLAYNILLWQMATNID